jgi:hypothetical protein
MEGTPDESPMKKAKTTPKGTKKKEVWAQFTEEDGKRSCRWCRKCFALKTSVTILERHLNKHPKGSTTFNQEESEKYLTQCLLVHNISPLFLDSPLTRRWIESLKSGYSPPGRTTFTNIHVPKELHSLKSNMQEKMKDIHSFCLTFDGWSSSAVRGYLGLVVHGIDNTWTLQSFLLALRRVSNNETAEYVASLVKEVLYLQQPKMTANFIFRSLLSGISLLSGSLVLSLMAQAT